MRHVRMMAALLLILGFVVATAQGQTGAPGIRVTVPFRFAVGRTTFSAGQYSVFSSRDKIWIQDANARNVAVSYTGALEGKVPEKNGKIIFDCYLGECFLSQVWIAGLQAGRELPRLKHQIELEGKTPGQQFVLLGANSHR
jgi:hypothetical protein